MFFFFPFGGGGFFGIFFLFILLRLIIRSLGNNQNNKNNNRFHYYYYEFNNNQQQNYQQTAQKKVSANAYAVLGVSQSATDDEIKKAYRKLILEYHPDKVAAKGLGDEWKDFASKKFREVQEAYETICKERNIK